MRAPEDPREVLRRVFGYENFRGRQEEIVRHAVRGMLPHNKLGRAQLRKLKIYAGSEHPHEAQNPEVLEIKE